MDKILAGNEPIDTVRPIELFAGEKQVVTSRGIAASGNIFGRLDDQGHTDLFAVVAEVGGLLVPWDPTADSNAPAAYATATVTLANAVPVAGDIVTVNGVDLEFVALADDDTALEVTIGATLAESAANLAAAINENRNDFGHPDPITATVSGAVVTVRAPGDAGEAVTLARTFATGANAAVSAATLQTGTDNDAAPGGARVPVGVIPHYLDTSASGTNANTETPLYVEGVFNFSALQTPLGTTLAELRSAFRRSGIVIEQLN